MPQCPDCDSMKLFCDPPEGDGTCSSCHGTFFSEFFDITTIGYLYGQAPWCNKCGGTGRCQTCRGTGVVREDKMKIAA